MTRLILWLINALIAHVPNPRVALECDHHGYFYPGPDKACPSCPPPPALDAPWINQGRRR